MYVTSDMDLAYRCCWTAQTLIHRRRVCRQAVGLLSGYHTAVVMGGLYYKVHGLRLAQASEMQLDLKADRPHGTGRPAKIHMQLDGEPWQQELPCQDAEPPLHVSIASGLLMHAPCGQLCCLCPE